MGVRGEKVHADLLPHLPMMNQIARSIPSFRVPPFLSSQATALSTEAQVAIGYDEILDRTPCLFFATPHSSSLKFLPRRFEQPASFPQQPGINQSDRMYGLSFQNSSLIRSQCKTAIRVNVPFFLPPPLSTVSNMSSPFETWSALVSKEKRQGRGTSYLPRNNAALPHSFRDVVVVYSKPFKQQLILLRRICSLQSPLVNMAPTASFLGATYT